MRETQRSGHTELPEEQARTLRKAVRVERVTFVVILVTAVLTFIVAGNSQAMKTAWIEDLLSLIPPVAFLVGVRLVRRRPTIRHPYGYHRSIGVSHLVSAVALLVMGLVMIGDAGLKLVTLEHASIGAVHLFGEAIWLGWFMMGLMVIIMPPPIILGRIKMKLAKTLHNKVLHADADMNKADWHTQAAAIVGVAGIGVGIWWADSAAALFISIGIVADGVRNLKAAVTDLVDARATTFDNKEPHPLGQEVNDSLTAIAWVKEAGSRVRDEGQVFHIEAFVVADDGQWPTADQLVDAREKCIELDWKIQDIVIIPVPELPREQLPLEEIPKR